MNTRTNRTNMMATMVIAVLCIFAGRVTMRAQCPLMNRSGCAVYVTVYDIAGVTYTQLISSLVANYAMPAGFNPIGIVSDAGVQRPFTPAPPAAGCAPCTFLRTQAGGRCCVQVCYDPATCTFTLNAGCNTGCLP